MLFSEPFIFYSYFHSYAHFYFDFCFRFAGFSVSSSPLEFVAGL